MSSEECIEDRFLDEYRISHRFKLKYAYMAGGWFFSLDTTKGVVKSKYPYFYHIEAHSVFDAWQEDDGRKFITLHEEILPATMTLFFHSMIEWMIFIFLFFISFNDNTHSTLYAQ